MESPKNGRILALDEQLILDVHFFAKQNSICDCFQFGNKIVEYPFWKIKNYLEDNSSDSTLLSLELFNGARGVFSSDMVICNDLGFIFEINYRTSERAKASGLYNNFFSFLEKRGYFFRSINLGWTSEPEHFAKYIQKC